MSYSQEIYDAARSRIGRMDSSTIERVSRECFDISSLHAHAQQELYRVSGEMTRPSVLYRPEVELDGDHYFLLYGQDLMAGCAGFGRTMAEAMADFDKNWIKQKAPTPAKAKGEA